MIQTALLPVSGQEQGLDPSVAGHLEHCPRCREELARRDEVARLLQGLPQASPTSPRLRSFAAALRDVERLEGEDARLRGWVDGVPRSSAPARLWARVLDGLRRETVASGSVGVELRPRPIHFAASLAAAAVLVLAAYAYLAPAGGGSSLPDDRVEEWGAALLADDAHIEVRTRSEADPLRSPLDQWGPRPGGSP